MADRIVSPSELTAKQISDFWLMVEDLGPDGCWEWVIISRDPKGYGVTHINGRNYYAHRIAWMLTNGPIEPGLSILHKCDHPPCCNPKHLYAGTHKDNMRDMVTRGRHVGFRKLNPGDVRDIRAMLDKGILQREIAEKYAITRVAVSNIKRKKTWAHV